MSTTHACPGGCGRNVPHHHLACRSCWYRLPTKLRTSISVTYRRDRGAHAAALVNAIRWYAEHPRGGTR
ncbi:hypothetical protein [Phytoactinopolyspora limicola]|uniref:hypothetical protein n=1 Tax=Phytoactinopolyspora limicola TaxID=2715536 RepID=UPI00140D564F|nr:hypothetical protein [Phytoactinopolyspora limicola]